MKIEIIESFSICPYCMNQPHHEAFGCCGESSAHFTEGYRIEIDGVEQDEWVTELELMELEKKAEGQK